MKIYKIFVIQPKTELSIDKIYNDRQRALGILQKFLGKNAKIETLDQLSNLYIGMSNDDGPLSFLGKDIQLIGKCDFVLVCERFGYDKRSKMQMQVCVEYNIPRVFECDIQNMPPNTNLEEFDNFLNLYEWRDVNI